MRIGICSPGLGLLSLCIQVAKTLSPGEIVLYCDNANAPYGSRPTSEVARLVQKMLEAPEIRHCDVVVLSCNTSSLSLPALSPPVHTIGIIEPTISAIQRQFTHTDSVLLLGTNATIDSGHYQRSLLKTGARVSAVAIPKLAAAIDQGDVAAQKQAIADSLDGVTIDCSSVLLVCTHFPLAQPALESYLSDRLGHALQFFSQEQWVCEELRVLTPQHGTQTNIRLTLTAPSPFIERTIRGRLKIDSVVTLSGGPH